MSREPETISVTELRNSTRQVIENAHFRGRRYLVERAGQPMVFIMGFEEYEVLLAQATAQHAKIPPLEGPPVR